MARYPQIELPSTLIATRSDHAVRRHNLRGLIFAWALQFGGCHHMKLPHRRRFLHLAAAASALPAVSRFARAQPTREVASSEKGTRVITLGTRSGPGPTVGRAPSSNLLVVNDAQYIIDAGDAVTRRLTKLGTNFRNIDNISSRILIATISADWER